MSDVNYFTHMADNNDYQSEPINIPVMSVLQLILMKNVELLLSTQAVQSSDQCFAQRYDQRLRKYLHRDYPVLICGNVDSLITVSFL